MGLELEKVISLGGFLGLGDGNGSNGRGLG